MTKAKKATFIATLSAAILTIIKLTVGIISGSVSIIASAIDSILDMFVSIFNMFAITTSEKPADETFNYGRGKIEALASVIEGSVIMVSGFFILYQAIKKAITSEEITNLDISLEVMIVSFFITLSLVVYLNKIAKQTGSMVIKADALHYKTDLWTNGAVLASIVIVYYTNFFLIDSIIGGFIAIYIAYSAYELIKDGVLVLLDKALEIEMVRKIEIFINEKENVTSFHHLKTREAANDIFVDVHVVFNCLISLLEAHKTADEIEEKIRQLDEEKNWVINIHLDPFDDSIDGVGCISSKHL